MHSTDQHKMARLAEATNPFQAHIWQQALQECNLETSLQWKL